LLPLM